MSRKNNTYSNDLKLEIVQTYLIGNESMQKIADRYEIRNVVSADGGKRNIKN